MGVVATWVTSRETGVTVLQVLVAELEVEMEEQRKAAIMHAEEVGEWPQ